jgi:hypothetical protein
VNVVDIHIGGLPVTSCSATPWGRQHHRSGPFPRRSLEIAAIVAGFFVAWPAALAYVVWKFAGYPFFDQVRGWVDRVQGGGRGFAFAGGFDRGFQRSSGNLAFDEYRSSEIERLERERRRLDEERREFGAFVEELKRAKDREEFDAFMAKRRGAGPVVDG